MALPRIFRLPWPGVFAVRTVLFLTLAVLGGCAEDLMKYSAPDGGMVVLSISTVNEQSFDSYYLVFRKVGVRANGIFEWKKAGVFADGHHDFEDSRTSGEVFVQKLPEGSYELVGISFRKRFVRDGESDPFDPPIGFTVKANETVYIGNIHVVPTCGNGIFWNVCTNPTLRIRDRSERDIPIAHAKQPALYPVRVALIQSDSLYFRPIPQTRFHDASPE